MFIGFLLSGVLFVCLGGLVFFLIQKIMSEPLFI